MELLRGDLLGGRTVVVVGCAASLVARLSGLGARVVEAPDGFGSDDDEGAEAWARAAAPIDALVCDAGFSRPSQIVRDISSQLGAVERGEALEAVDRAWPVVRAVAAGAMIPGADAAREADPLATRKMILIGPRPDAAPHADAARAALENLVRTLSVEWARFGITTAMIATGRDTSTNDVETLVALLCSRAGHYYSGCRFDLGAVTVSH